MSLGMEKKKKKDKEKLSWNLTINALFMESCIAAFAEKITWHQQFPRKAELEKERSLASIILKAAAEMYGARKTPAAGFVSGAKGFTLEVDVIAPGEYQHAKIHIDEYQQWKYTKVRIPK